MDTNVTNFDDVIINDDDLSTKLKFESLTGDKKYRKNMDNMKHKLAGDNQNSYIKGDDLTITVDGDTEKSCKERDIKDALAAIDSAILVHTDYETCYVTHM